MQLYCGMTKHGGGAMPVVCGGLGHRQVDKPKGGPNSHGCSSVGGGVRVAERALHEQHTAGTRTRAAKFRRWKISWAISRGSPT